MSATAEHIPQVEVLNAFSVGGMSERRLISLAAAAPEGSTDDVDLALANYIVETHADVPVPRVPAEHFDAARSIRRFSLTKVDDYPWSDMPAETIIVMRGELDSVIAEAKSTREQRALIRRNAQQVEMRGCRPLAVAVARQRADGSRGPFQLEGFVTVKPLSVHGFEDEMTSRPGDWVRVNLWSPLVRWQHWINVALIFVMSCTGYYIMHPFVGPIARTGVETGYLMGWVRLVHYIAAFSWVLLGLTRLYLLFTAKDRFLRWPALWPLWKGEDVKNLGRVAMYYTFIKKHAPLYVAHNPLQQLTYTGIYALGGLQIITGTAIYALYHRYNWFWGLLATPVEWIGIPHMRLLHALIMFVFWAFVIAHVYLAVRADSIERHGGVSAMLNGGVWMRRGSKPVDAPPID
ncbi:Ni/Fe-hydrogenase, b-type cytochrome subunit [Luteococcus sp. OSA5]|uniref:Ni/Fe-hydrogenase, b-type cytochrome subunit n=1 Tax=Luteococcus sp. OSA5 TaxID=3401630 RepID=UPI003B43065A